MHSSSTADLPLSSEERDFLGRHGFDEKSFTELRLNLQNGEFSSKRNILHAQFRPPVTQDLASLSDENKLIESGLAAIEEGKVGIAILNGGMATRFKGLVKGIVPVFDNRSFLELKVSELKERNARVPVFLMNSFATAEDTSDHLLKNNHFGLNPDTIHSLTQNISLRLTPEGELFRTTDGSPSFYAPGHGDLFETLRSSDSLSEERKRGLEYLLVSNVDNLAANLSPAIIGAHIRNNNPVTVEVAPRNQGDRGGAPVYVNDRLEIVEGFRFPPEFDQDTLPVFNTNTFVFNVEIFDPTYPLTWFRADKLVNNQPVVQFERLMGQITSFVQTTFLTVPRIGPEGRFMPIKTPQDLERLSPSIRNRFI